jgi:response regulator of citrate/malate metabolism
MSMKNSNEISLILQKKLTQKQILPSGIEPATFGVVAQYVNQLRAPHTVDTFRNF